MPLIQSPTKFAISQNIATERAAGRPRAQSVAIALSEARKNGAKIPPPKNKPSRKYYPEY